jgi:lysophospholipase L1-like esterase
MMVKNTKGGLFMKDLAQLDKNFSIAEVDGSRFEFRDCRQEPFRIYGLILPNEEDPCFMRMPSKVAETVNEGVLSLANRTAGGRIRFRTDSSCIAIRVKLHSVYRGDHFPMTGSAGFDLYADGIFIKSFVPPYDIEGGYESVITLPSNKDRLITINFPLYNSVASLEIGLDDGFMPGCAEDYRFEKPVVFYGSSITQGGCASRPGTCYQSILSRCLDFNFINLGFSGSGRAEPAISEYMAGLDMSVFVMDYDHNAPSVEYLADTHERLFNTIRAKQPDLPILMLSRPKYYLNEAEIMRRDIIIKTYENALAKGDKNVWFIDGSTLMPPEIRNEGTVDDCHPTDLGFYFMAKGIMPVLKEILEGLR